MRFLKIKQLGPTRFQTVGPLGAVIVDFATIIEKNQLSGDFVLGHWNRMLCKPAFYDSASQSYHWADEDQIRIQAPAAWVGIPKLDNPGILPTSCNLHLNASLRRVGEALVIQENEPTALEETPNDH